MPARNTPYSIPETISTSAGANVDGAISVQLVKNTELDNELDGIESCFGMCWGELRKWVNHPMNYINLQPDLVELLRRKDALICPTPALMAQIEEHIQYNARHPQAEVHFLKRFPQGTYEYTVIPTIHTGPIFSQREETSRSSAHLAPYYETLVFKSDAHPCFVLSFTTLDIIGKWLRSPLINSDLFPIQMCAIYESLPQPLHFYYRPYLGWIPRKLPTRHLGHLRLKSSSHSDRLPAFPYAESSSSQDIMPPRKRHKHLPTSRLQVTDGDRTGVVENWRYNIISSDIMSMDDDEELGAYQREKSRRLPDVMGQDPLFRRIFTCSPSPREFALSSKRKRVCAAGQ